MNDSAVTLLVCCVLAIRSVACLRVEGRENRRLEPNATPSTRWATSGSTSTSPTSETEQSLEMNFGSALEEKLQWSVYLLMVKRV